MGTVADPESNRLGDLMTCTLETLPRLKLELHHTMSGAALADVHNGELDASFFFGDAPASEFFAIQLRRLIYRVAAPREWAERVDGAQWDEIARMPWISDTRAQHAHAPCQRFICAAFAATAERIGPGRR